MNYKALYEKQEEIIVCYKNIMAGRLECISDLDRLESAVHALESEPAKEQHQNICHSCGESMSNDCDRCKHLWES